jgi:hypothetical protein
VVIRTRHVTANPSRMSADDARTLRGLTDWLGQLAAPVKEGAVGEAVLAAYELAASSIPATPAHWYAGIDLNNWRSPAVCARRANQQNPVKPLRRKYSCSHLTQISGRSLPSRPERGALAIVTNVGTGCGGRGSVGAQGDRRAVIRERFTARRRTTLKRTAKPCGPGTRCWCQVGGGVVNPTGFHHYL